jgi:hypothetical protein
MRETRHLSVADAFVEGLDEGREDLSPIRRLQRKVRRRARFRRRKWFG